MNKVYLFLFAVIVLLNVIIASPVDSIIAKKVATNFYLQHAALPGLNKENVNLSLAYKRTDNNNDIYYVYNTTNNSGWIIVAADDAIAPILAYSLEGNYSNTNQPPAFTEWMNSCKDQIQYIIQDNVASDITTLTKWNHLITNTVDQTKSTTKSVAPLITTNWDQGCYYNTLCPTDAAGDCNHVYTGCVATAMAQIMRYWSYPATGVGSYSYTHPTYGTQTANFGATTYNWGSMPNNVTSNNSAVATLMYHCGVSVDMDYGASGSGAYSEAVPDALINYFSYKNTAQFVYLDDYSTLDWIYLLEAELNAHRPIHYSGDDGSSGHAFVCDGYDNSDYFHFNWGWSGAYNGYFAIGSLDAGGYYPNNDNGAVINIEPNSAITGDSLHYDSENNSGIGTGAASSFGVYAYFPAATLASHAAAGHEIVSVKLFIVGATNLTSTQLRFYSNTGTTLLYSQNFYAAEGWNNIVLTTPFPVPSTGNLYIGYYLSTTGGYPAGCDAGPVDPNGNWIDINGVWQHLTDLEPTLTCNWNIRAICGALASVPTASCNPLSWAAGNVNINTTKTSGIFTLSNIGSGTLTCSGITGLSAPYTTNLVPSAVSLAPSATKTFTFSYHPTVAANNNNTVVIATNGGNITINLSGTGIDQSGIDDTETEDLFSLFPNPASDKITIENPGLAGDELLSIFNIQGELLLIRSKLEAKTEIDISSLSKGLYYLELTTSEGSIVKKFVKE